MMHQISANAVPKMEVAETGYQHFWVRYWLECRRAGDCWVLEIVDMFFDQ
jgi:hypothetical protein